MKISIPDMFERLINDNEEYIITIKQTKDEKGIKVEYDFKSIDEECDHIKVTPKRVKEILENDKRLKLRKRINEMEEETKSDSAVKELLLTLCDFREYEAALYIFKEWQRDHSDKSVFNIYSLMNLVKYHDYKPSGILNCLFVFHKSPHGDQFWCDIRNKLRDFEETGEDNV
jgi:hypothetical protein